MKVIYWSLLFVLLTTVGLAAVATIAAYTQQDWKAVGAFLAVLVAFLGASCWAAGKADQTEQESDQP